MGKKRPRKFGDEEVERCEAVVAKCKAAVARRFEVHPPTTKRVSKEERALEEAEKELAAAKAQTPAAVEASGIFSMLSDFEIVEILSCLVERRNHQPYTAVFGEDHDLPADLFWLCAVAATCWRLHALAFSSELWRRFNLAIVVHLEEKHFAKKLCSAPWISACESFSFSFLPPPFGLVKKMPSLRKLSINLREEDESMRSRDCMRLASAMRSLHHLRKLDLSGPGSEVLRFFRLENTPVESLSLSWEYSFEARVFPRVTELQISGSYEEAIARAFPNLRKLRSYGDLGAFWKHCHHLEDVRFSAEDSSHLRFDVLAESPCSQTLRRFFAWQVDCTELARAAPNLVTVDIFKSPTNIAGLAGLAHLQELRFHGGTFEELNELGERARRMRLKKLTLLTFGDGGEADLTRFFASPCCSQLEELHVYGFSIDSCIAGLTSQSGPLLLRSFESRHCPSNLSALLAKCPALTKHLF